MHGEMLMILAYSTKSGHHRSIKVYSVITVTARIIASLGNAEGVSVRSKMGTIDTRIKEGRTIYSEQS